MENGTETFEQVATGTVEKPKRGRPSKAEKKEEALNRQLALVPATVLPDTTENHMHLAAEMTYEEWETRLRYCRVLDKGLPWYVGELMLFAEFRGADWHNKAIQAASELGFDDARLLHITAVVRAFSPNPPWAEDKAPERTRHTELSFTHHEEVYGLAPELANELLEKAEDKHLTTAELRDEIRSLRAKGVAPGSKHPGRPRKEKLTVSMIDEAVTLAQNQGGQNNAPETESGLTAQEQPPAEHPSDGQSPAVNLEDADRVLGDHYKAAGGEAQDWTYDMHAEVRERAREAVVNFQCQIVSEAVTSDMSAAYQATQDAIMILLELRNSYEELGVTPEDPRDPEEPNR